MSIVSKTQHSILNQPKTFYKQACLDSTKSFLAISSGLKLSQLPLKEVNKVILVLGDDFQVSDRSGSGRHSIEVLTGLVKVFYVNKFQVVVLTGG